jgi:hypothetical protein
LDYLKKNQIRIKREIKGKKKEIKRRIKKGRV